MDVGSLSWFAGDNKARLSEEILLNNTNLIICSHDLADNLYRWMCRNDCLPLNYGSDLFGPNLVLYAQMVEEFFNLLEECRIKPIIVEGRSLSRTEEKWRYEGNYIQSELVKRGKEAKKVDKDKKEIDKWKDIREVVQESRVEPSSLIYLIFKQVVKKLVIETLHSNEKYRFEMIKLANELDCPLLTFCCDYLMYPMRRGFIRLDLDFFDRQNIVLDDMNNKSIRCPLFSHKKLLSTVPGLQSKSVPSLAVMMDFDSYPYVPFGKAFMSIRENYETQFEHKDFPANKIIGSYLEWMRDKSWEELRREFCISVHDNGGEIKYLRKIREELGIAMDQRMDNEIGLDYKTILESYYMQCNESAKPAVDYLINLIEEMRLDKYVLYIVTCRQVYFDLIYRNDTNKVSTNCLKIRPYSVVLCLLRPTGVMIDNSIWLFDLLDGKRYVRRLVKQAERLEGFGSLNCLHINSLVTISGDDKKKLLLSTFRVLWDTFDGLDSLKNPDLINEIRLCLIIVKYINEESRLGDYKTAPLDRSFVEALILTCLFYMTSKFDQPPSGLPFENVLLMRRELEAVAETLNDRGDLEIYQNIAHQMSSIECAIEVFCMLNSLLGQVFPQPRLDVWFNGPLIFKLARMIETGQVEGLTCLSLASFERITGQLLA